MKFNLAFSAFATPARVMIIAALTVGAFAHAEPTPARLRQSSPPEVSAPSQVKETEFRKTIVLTLDDGWYAPEKFVEMLLRHDADATFFITGEALKAHPDAWRDALHKGFDIGCHTMRHKASSTLSESSFRQELKTWRITAQEILGVEAAKTSLFRFPYGDTGKKKTARFRKILQEEGFTEYSWDTDISTPYYPMALAWRNNQMKLRLSRAPVASPVVLGHFTRTDFPVIEEMLVWAKEQNVKVIGLAP